MGYLRIQYHHRSKSAKPSYDGLDKDIELLCSSYKDAGFKAAWDLGLGLIDKWKLSVGSQFVPAELYLFLGRFCSKEGKKDIALAVYDQGLAVNPKSRGLLMAKADELLRSGKFTTATDLYRQAHEIKPSMVTAERYASCLLAQGENEKALRVVSPFVTKVLESTKAIGDVGILLAINLAGQKTQLDFINCLRLYSENNAFKNPVNVLQSIRGRANILKKEFGLGSDADVAYKDGVLGRGQSDDAILARKILAAYAGAGHFWDTAHERRAVNSSTARAAGTKGCAP